MTLGNNLQPSLSEKTLPRTTLNPGERFVNNMPVSRRRKKADSASVVVGSPTPIKLDNPSWLVPAMVGLFIVGLAWLVVFYLAPGLAPFARLGNLWSVVVGFVFLAGGFSLATRWR